MKKLNSFNFQQVSVSEVKKTLKKEKDLKKVEGVDTISLLVD